MVKTDRHEDKQGGDNQFSRNVQNRRNLCDPNKKMDANGGRNDNCRDPYGIDSIENTAKPIGRHRKLDAS